jgi:WD40 repeat protein
VATKQIVASLEGHEHRINSLAFSPNGQQLATAAGSTIKIWDIATRREGHTFREPAPDTNFWCAAFAPDGKTLVSGSNNGAVRFWDLPSGRLVTSRRGHSAGVNAVVFSADGKTLATGSEDHLVKLWSVPTAREVVTLRGHAYAVKAVAFSPQGDLLASSGADTTVRLWRAPPVGGQ